MSCFPPGAVWELHLHPLRGVASGQSASLRCYDDVVYQRTDAAQHPAGDHSHSAGGQTGAPAEQRARSVRVRHAPQGSASIMPSGLYLLKHLAFRFRLLGL